MPLLSGILGGVQGGSEAVNQLSGERRKQLADQLRIQTLDLMNQQQQERGFKHAESMAETAHIRQQESKLDDDRIRAEEAEESHRRSKELEATKPPQYQAVTTGDGVYMVDKANPQRRERIGDAPPKSGSAAKDREPPASLSKMLWENAEKQAKSGAGIIFGRKSKEEINQRTMEIYRGFLSDLGYGPDVSTPSRPGGVLPPGPGRTTEQPQTAPSGVDWRQWDVANPQALNEVESAAPGSEGVLPPAAAAGIVPPSMPQGRTREPVSPASRVQKQIKGPTPEERKAAIQEVTEIVNKAGLGKENWKAAWDLLSSGAKAVWGTYANFVNSVAKDLAEGQRVEREKLTRPQR